MQIFRLENQCYIGIIHSFLPRGSPAHVYIRVEIQQKDILVAVHKLCNRDRGRAGKTLFMIGGVAKYYDIDNMHSSTAHLFS